MDVKSTSFFYAPLLGYIGGATIATTIVLCYILTVSLDHDVPVWLPMISRCAVGFPEKFLFRIGVVPSAALFAVQILVVYKDDRGYSRSRVALLFGVVACVSLILVGNVNEREWSTVHNYSAVAFFFSFLLYMITITALSYSDKRISLPSKITKQFCTIIAFVALMITGILSALSFHKYEPYIAMCEWTGAFSIITFLMVLGHDMSGVSINQVRSKERNARFCCCLRLNSGADPSEKIPLLQQPCTTSTNNPPDQATA